MALMPEDLEEKRFTPVRFTEGYDMDEVDNYLDHDVIPRLKELIEENERLKSQLDEAHNRVSELESRASAASAVDTASETVVEEEQDTVAAPVAEEPTEDTAAAMAGPAASGTSDAAGLIALAQRLHDEHVANGESERDRLISEAESEHKRIIDEANETSRTTLESLETQKAELEQEIEGLRTFERDYRSRLRRYLENQLQDLDTSETQESSASRGL